MKPLASFLLERGAVGPADLDEAMRRQALGGGDLGSHLLGLGSLDEGRLLALLGEYHGLPLGPAGRLPPMPLELARLMPPNAARRYRVFPLGLTRRELHVGTAAPLDSLVAQQLAVALGHPLRQVVVSPLRLGEALWRYAGAPFNAALRDVVARLDGAAAAADESPGQRPVSHLSRQQAAKPYRRMQEESGSRRVVATERGSASPLLSGVRGAADPTADEDEQELLDELDDDRELENGWFEPGSEFELGSEGPTTQRSGNDGSRRGQRSAAAAVPSSGPYGRPVESGPEIIVAVQPDFAADQVDEATPAVGGRDESFVLRPEVGALGPDDATPPQPDATARTAIAAESPEAVAPMPIAAESPDAPPPGEVDQEAETRHGSELPELPPEPELGDALRAHDDAEGSDRATALAPGARGPLGREQAERLLGEAEDVQQTLELFVRFAQQFFERVLLLVMQGGRAEGRFGHGLATDAAAIKLELGRPSLIQHAHDTAQIVVDRLGADGPNGLLRSTVGLTEEVEVVAIPILVRQRVVAVLYADDAGLNVDRDAVAEVAGFSNVVGNAIAMLIVRRKREKT